MEAAPSPSIKPRLVGVDVRVSTMAETALAYTYRYPAESAVATVGGHAQLTLAAQIAPGPSHFLRGRIVEPKRTGELLLGLMEVVGARFFVPGAMLARILRLADPVVTCGERRLRLEAFSQCCGAYARVDLRDSEIDGDLLNPGTTNVDFNPPMRAALARLAPREPAFLTIGADRVELESSRGREVERKVKLPQRWLRGFVEVQAVQARMEPRFTASGAALRRLLQELRAVKGVCHVSAAGPALRMQTSPQPGAVPVGGIERLKVLARAARYAESVEVLADGATGASAWVVHAADARFQYVLSPEPARGFSGEGQVLETLAAGTSPATGAVRAALRWQPDLAPASIAAETGRTFDEVKRALAACAASGLVGFDLADRAYFHRELPFNLTLIEKHQARLTNARQLASGEAVELESPDRAWVTSGDKRYLVAFGAAPSCTCPWVARHGATRGPCKHILAARAASSELEVS